MYRSSHGSILNLSYGDGVSGPFSLIPFLFHTLVTNILSKHESDNVSGINSEAEKAARISDDKKAPFGASFVIIILAI